MNEKLMTLLASLIEVIEIQNNTLQFVLTKTEIEDEYDVTSIDFDILNEYLSGIPTLSDTQD